MLACAWAFGGTAAHGRFENAGAVAAGLRTHVSPLAGTLFAIALLDASLLGAAAVTLASSYAVGDYFGFKHSLHRGWRDASTFHGTYVAFVALAAMVVLIPGAPLGLITIGVQALAGVLLPSATVFLLLLCNDHDVLGPWSTRAGLTRSPRSSSAPSSYSPRSSRSRRSFRASTSRLCASACSARSQSC